MAFFLPSACESRSWPPGKTGAPHPLCPLPLQSLCQHQGLSLGLRRCARSSPAATPAAPGASPSECASGSPYLPLTSLGPRPAQGPGAPASGPNPSFPLANSHPATPAAPPEGPRALDAPRVSPTRCGGTPRAAARARAEPWVCAGPCRPERVPSACSQGYVNGYVRLPSGGPEFCEPPGHPTCAHGT